MKKQAFNLLLSFLIAYAGLLQAQDKVLSPSLKGQIIDESCDLVLVNTAQKKLVQSKRRFRRGTAINYRALAGMSYMGRKFPIRSQLILIQDPARATRFYVGQGRCLLGDGFEAPTLKSQLAAESARRSPTRSNLEVGASLLTFKSKGALIIPDEEEVYLTAQFVGVQPEISYRWRSDHLEFALGLGIFTGMGELGLSYSEKVSATWSETGNYQASNVFVIGGEVSPSLLYRPNSKNASIGLKLPFNYLRHPWPVPEADVKVVPQSGFSMSYLLEVRLERDAFTFFQNIGLHKKWGNVAWAIGASYRL
jgi:hypothetical protein